MSDEVDIIEEPVVTRSLVTRLKELLEQENVDIVQVLNVLFDTTDEYAVNGDLHRFIYKPLRDENKDMGVNGEIVVDINKGIFYIRGDDGVLRSAYHSLVERFEALERAGLIQAALAFYNNSKVYIAYVRGNKIYLDSMLRLDRNIRYYAIRGAFNDRTVPYITGTLVGGVPENCLFDVVPITDDPTVAHPGKPTIGILHTPSEVISGHIYYIDFFDSDRGILSSVPCQVVRGDVLDFSLTPDKNIVAIEISTNQDMIDPATGNEVAFLYQGQAFNTLNIYIAAVYANGDKRYINHDLATSRLLIDYPEVIDTMTIGSSFNIDAKYYTEEVNTGADEISNDLHYASVDATKKVIIVPDVFVGVKYLLPVPMIKTLEDGSKSIQLHVFAHYENGTFIDVTASSRLTSSNFAEEMLGINQIFSLVLGLGHGGATFTESNINLTMNPLLFGRWTRLVVPNAPKSQYDCHIARFDPISNPGQIRMKLLKSTSDVFTTTDEFARLGNVTVGVETTTPTHFRVRSVLDSSFMHTIEPIPVSRYGEFIIMDTHVVPNKLAGFAANNNSVPYPIVVEFYVYDAVLRRYNFLSAHPFVTQMQVFAVVGDDTH
jgi:hypothetical protein